MSSYTFVRLTRGGTLRWKQFDLDLWGQNLLEEQHPEIYSVFLFPSGEVPRSFHGRLSARF